MAAMFLPTFWGPVLGVMMKQVCWHSRRAEAHRGLPEARSWMQNVLWRSLYAAMLLEPLGSSFWPTWAHPGIAENRL